MKRPSHTPHRRAPILPGIPYRQPKSWPRELAEEQFKQTQRMR